MVGQVKVPVGVDLGGPRGEFSGEKSEMVERRVACDRTWTPGGSSAYLCSDGICT